NLWATSTDTMDSIAWIFGCPTVRPAGVLVKVMHIGDVPFKYQAVGIHQIVSVRPLEQHVQIKAFVAEIVGKSAHVYRQAVSNHGLIVCIDDTVSVYILVLDV